MLEISDSRNFHARQSFVGVGQASHPPNEADDETSTKYPPNNGAAIVASALRFKSSKDFGVNDDGRCVLCSPAFGLVPTPWLNRLHRRLPDIVRRLRGYYRGVRFPVIVRHRLRLLPLPMRLEQRALRALPVDRGSSRFSFRACGGCDNAGSSRRLQMARPCVRPGTFGSVPVPVYRPFAVQ